MSRRTYGLDGQLYEYFAKASLREPPVLAKLRDQTATMPGAGMQLSPEQGQFMALLVELTSAKRYVEVGTFTGYSSLSVALAMPDDGAVVACDVSRDYTDVARRFWEEAGVVGKIDLRIGPAVATLRELAKSAAGSFDIAFIDANKDEYDDYYELCLTLVRTGGLVLIDNVLWGGAVADPDLRDPDTAAIRALNAKIQADQRVTQSLLPIGDGLTIALKR